MALYFNTPMLNKIFIIGNVVGEPKTRRTNGNGVKVSNFRIACSRKFRTKTKGLKEEICYVNITAWMRLAEICENNLQKGDRVYIEGTLQNQQNNKAFVEILAERIQILTPKKIISNVQQEEANIEFEEECIEDEMLKDLDDTCNE